MNPFEILCVMQIKTLLRIIFWNSSSRISSAHTYNTRASTSEHFYTKESRLNVKRNAFSRVGVKIWNGIPQILKERPKKAFKRSLKAMLLDILQT